MTRTVEQLTHELRVTDLKIAAWAGTRRATVKGLRVVRARLLAELEAAQKREAEAAAVERAA